MDHGPFGILGTGKSRWAKITAGRGFEAGGFVYYLDLENGRHCFVRRLPAAAPSSGALRWRRCSGIPVDRGQSVNYSSVNPPATRILKAEVRLEPRSDQLQPAVGITPSCCIILDVSMRMRLSAILPDRSRSNCTTSLHFNMTACRRNAEERVPMRSGPGEARDHLVAFTDLLGDLPVDVGEGGLELHEGALQALSALQLAGQRIKLDKVLEHEVVQAFPAGLVENVFDEGEDDLLVGVRHAEFSFQFKTACRG